MITPAGDECRFYYEDFHRGRSTQECRLIGRNPESEPWEESLCSTCPVPGILQANGSPHLALEGKVVRRFFFLKRHLEKPLLVGGDFNYSRLLDDLYGERGNHEFFDRIQTEGFFSLHRKFHDSDQQTFFQKRGRGHQLDYLYGDKTVGEMASSCEVCDYDQVQDFSDHAPLVADFNRDV